MLLAGSLLIAGLAGCSSSQAGPGSATAASSGDATAAASGSGTAQPGQTLAGMGFRNGPRNFTVPDDLVLTDRVDQTNVVTLVMDGGQGHRVHDYLLAELPGQGWRIEASSEDSIVFSTDGWEGAFTTTDARAGLTLRRLG